jgi:hypothetical protein
MYPSAITISDDRRLILTPFDQYALQAADHDDWQNDVLVLVGFELAAQALGGFPDLVG